MALEILPGLIIAIPFLAAAFNRIPGLSDYRTFVDWISIIAAALVATLAGVLCFYALESPVIHWVGGWEPREGTVIGITLVADATSTGFIFITAVLTTAALAFIYKRYETIGSFMHILTLIFLGAFSGFVLAGDLLTMFVFLELMGICSYILTAFKIRDEAPIQAGFNVAVVATVGSFIFLMGSAMMYGLVDTPNIAQAADRLSNLPASPALGISISLLITGLAVKTALFPFHFAHADSHSVAPAPHAGLFGAVLMQAGLYGIARLSGLLLDVPAINIEMFPTLLITAGVLTAIIGAVMSIAQNHLKRLLAFSGIAHIGIAAVGVGVLNTNGLAGASLYVVGHAAVKMSLFLIAGVILHQFSTIFAGKLSGLSRKSWILTAMLVVGALALAGVPPSGLYGGKVLIEEGLKDIGLGWIIYILYFSAALTGAAVIRFTVRVGSSTTPDDEDPVYVHEGSKETIQKGGFFYMSAIPCILLIAGVFITLSPQVTGGIERAAERDFNRSAYVDLVIFDKKEQFVKTATQDFWKIDYLAKGIASGLFAVGSGVIFASRRFDTSRIRRGPLAMLRNLHSGHVGDYMTWLIFGTVVTTGWFFWQL